ncbi:GNAT family N-acetyltransferase [Halobacillus shinanisalinarum]|uniref:GNAT family N-acetyltransferase n=1 Tax=Halobacillus shinanisalinarum TaxID=2932258 RepID=A0ABY4H3Z5_9BACI|nr:N-acetyltransferase [Halobacillus shinanisalinarum]UOQ95044.1 GNAT family N-acetyltransferase [Halobacillus shinanisalinarum]
MQIRELEVKELHTVAQWLHSMNEQDKHYVAWLASDPNEIFEQIWTLTQFQEPLAYVAWEQDEIIGFIGVLPFFDQNLARLLGPFTKEDNTDVIEQLWNKASLTLMLHFDIVKVACFKANQPLVSFAERHKFSLYNIEKTLAIHDSQFSPSYEKSTHISELSGNDMESLHVLHPAGAYYTTEEMVQLSHQDENKLFGYMENGHLVGYLYYETITAAEGEICFVNVQPNDRGEGIGTKLIEQALQYAFYIYGVDAVTLSVRNQNTQAEQLYQQLGFRDINTIYAYEKKLNDLKAQPFLH